VSDDIAAASLTVKPFEVAAANDSLTFYFRFANAIVPPISGSYVSGLPANVNTSATLISSDGVHQRTRHVSNCTVDERDYCCASAAVAGSLSKDDLKPRLVKLDSAPSLEGMGVGLIHECQACGTCPTQPPPSFRRTMPRFVHLKLLKGSGFIGQAQRVLVYLRPVPEMGPHKRGVTILQ